MPNQFSPINGSSDLKTAINQANNNFRKLDQEAVTKSFGGQNSQEKILIGKTGDASLGMKYQLSGEDKILFGKLPSGEYGLVFNDNQGLPSIYIAYVNGNPVFKVAKEGKNAQTGTGDDLVFNSAQDTLKVIKVDTVAVTPPATWDSMSTISVPVPHQQNVQPAIIAYVNNPTIPIIGYTSPGLTVTPSNIYLNSTGSTIYASTRVDATNMYFEITNVSTLTGGWNTYTWNFKYYLLQQSAL